MCSPDNFDFCSDEGKVDSSDGVSWSVAELNRTMGGPLVIYGLPTCGKSRAANTFRNAGWIVADCDDFHSALKGKRFRKEQELITFSILTSSAYDIFFTDDPSVNADFRFVRCDAGLVNELSSNRGGKVITKERAQRWIDDIASDTNHIVLSRDQYILTFEAMITADLQILRNRDLRMRTLRALKYWSDHDLPGDIPDMTHSWRRKLSSMGINNV